MNILNKLFFILIVFFWTEILSQAKCEDLVEGIEVLVSPSSTSTTSSPTTLNTTSTTSSPTILNTTSTTSSPTILNTTSTTSPRILNTTSTTASTVTILRERPLNVSHTQSFVTPPTRVILNPADYYHSVVPNRNNIYQNYQHQSLEGRPIVPEVSLFDLNKAIPNQGGYYDASVPNRNNIYQNYQYQSLEGRPTVFDPHGSPLQRNRDDIQHPIRYHQPNQQRHQQRHQQRQQQRHQQPQQQSRPNFLDWGSINVMDIFRTMKAQKREYFAQKRNVKHHYRQQEAKRRLASRNPDPNSDIMTRIFRNKIQRGINKFQKHTAIFEEFVHYRKQLLQTFLEIPMVASIMGNDNSNQPTRIQEQEDSLHLPDLSHNSRKLPDTRVPPYYY